MNDRLEFADELDAQIESSHSGCLAAMTVVVFFMAAFGVGMFMLGWWLASG